MSSKKYTRFKATGLTKEVKKVLTGEWQATPIIAAQVDVQPDAVARRMANNRTRSPGSAKSDIVGLAMKAIVRSGFAEKRKVNNRNEYRLAQPKRDQG